MRAALTLLFPFAVVLAGCGPKARQFGGQPRTKAPPSVVSLSPSAAEIVAGNMDVRQLVGRTKADDFPSSVLQVPVVAEVKPDFEAIKRLKPGLVVYDADLYNPADITRIEGMGAESFGVKAHTVEAFKKELFELASKLGSETNVSSYVDRIERERAAAAAEAPSPMPKIAVAMAGGYVAGTESFVADVVKIAGGVPVGPASTKFELASPEAMVAAAPDIIVLATAKATAAADFAKIAADPRFMNSPAIKNKKVIALPQDIVLRRGARVDAFIKDLHRNIMRLAAK